MKRNGKLDLLRFCFAFFIMALHYGWRPGFNLSNYYFSLGCHGELGVGFFLIVSGIFFAYTVDKPKGDWFDLANDTVLFVKRKYFQFVKYYIIALVLRTILDCFRIGLFTAILNCINSIPMCLLLGELGFDDNTIYDYGYYLTASWYISAIFIWFVILYPIMRNDFDKFMKIYALPVFMIAAGLYIRSYNENFMHLAYALTFLFVGFFIYCIVSRNLFHIDDFIKKNRVLMEILEVIIYVFIICLMCLESHYELMSKFSIILILGVAILITYSGNTNHQIFNRSIFHYIGRITLPLYLLHGQIQKIMDYVCDFVYGSGNDTFKVMFSYFLSIVLACVCICIEDSVAKKK